VDPVEHAPIRNYSRWRRVFDGSQRALTPTPWPTRIAGWFPGSARVGVERHEIVAPALRSSRALRIAFASDFHAGPTTSPRVLDAAIDRLIDAQPDVLLLGGDFVSLRASDARALMPMLAAVTAPLGRFAVLGNHDHWSDGDAVAALLEAAGIELLTNRNVALPAPFEHVSLCGLDDHTSGQPDADAAFRDSGPVKIVLMHAPSGLLDIGDRPFDVALCGHTHGGQVALPGGWPILVADGPLSRRYSAGPYALSGGRTLLVSRGVGCTALPIRMIAPAAIMVCTIAPAVRSW
jgi:predicted MPP superfamily phosphohydrolase